MPTLIGKVATTRSGVLTPPINGTASLTLSGYSKDIHGGAFSYVDLRAEYGFLASGHAGDSVNGVQAELSGYSATILGGGSFIYELTTPTLSASGTTIIAGTAYLELSGYSLISSGTTDKWGKARLTLLTRYSLSARGGGEATNSLSGYSFTAQGVTEAMGGVAKTLPTPTLTAHGIVDAIGSVVGILPPLQIAPSGKLVGVLPRATLLIIGTTQVAVGYEAYSFTLNEDSKGVTRAYGTHYTNYPFDQIVRYNDTYYGVAADGLYELDGETFDGEPIVAVVQTAPTDFKSREQKRPFSLYIGGRVSADFRVSVLSNEIDADSYIYRPVDKTGARNYRVLFGRGIRARYMAYAFTNIDGGGFEVDDMTPEVAVLRRTA